jgi:hypothetical protein
VLTATGQTSGLVVTTNFTDGLLSRCFTQSGTATQGTGASVTYTVTHLPKQVEVLKIII